jgi:photosystem II stability/assembly factor-like uncharacterized protein
MNRCLQLLLFTFLIVSVISKAQPVNGVDSLSATLNSQAKWESLGPNYRMKGNSTVGIGRFTSLWVNPTDHNTILAGSNSGGLWKTTNGGTNWVCLTDSIATGGISDIAVDERNFATVFISTKTSANGSLKFDGIYSMGLFKSTDGGKTWSKLSIDTKKNEYFERIAIDPENRSVVFALSNRSIYRSRNLGRSWKKLPLEIPEEAGLIDMEFKPGDSKTIYVSGKNALYLSQNKGKNWRSIKENLTNGFVNSRIALAVNPVAPEEVYILSTDLDNQNWDDTPNRLEKSTDSGETWSLVGNRKFTALTFTCELAVAPNGNIYAGGMALLRWQKDKGVYRALSSGSIHADLQKIVIPDKNNSNLIFVANDGGIYKDTTGGDNWININGDLATNEFYDVAIYEKDPQIMLAGSHDCGTYYRKTDGKWEFRTGGDGGTCLIDYNNPDIYYDTANRSFAREEPSAEYPILKLTHYDSPVVMDPYNSDVLYGSEWIKGDTPPVHFKRSTDRGSTWTTLEQEWVNVTDISICLSNPDYIYYSMWDPWAPSKVRRTTDGGETWSNVNHSSINNICNEAPITSVFVNPVNPLYVWIAFGGFEAGKKIYASTDGGDTWENISGNSLPNVPARCLQYDFVRKTLYLGTDIGLYQLNNGEKEWSFVEGFPKVISSSLKINKRNGDMVASTYGRGIWRTNLGMGYCEKSETPLEIDTIRAWDTEQQVCSDVLIKSGAELTVRSAAYLPYNASLVVQTGAKLIVDAAKLTVGSFVVEEGGEVIRLNDAEIIEIKGNE